MSKDVPISFEQINLLNNEEVLEETYKKLRLYYDNCVNKILWYLIISLFTIVVVVLIFFGAYCIILYKNK